MSAAIPAAGTCRSRPCWAPVNTTGVRYANRDGTARGVTKIVLRGGVGTASVTVTAKGANLAAPALPLAQQPAVTVQLRRTDASVCWESVFAGPPTRSDATVFKDRLP